MKKELTIREYNAAQEATAKKICNLLLKEIKAALPKAESKIWHRNPVWFIEGNPIVGYAVLKESTQLLFWSGQSFDEKDLEDEGSFKASQKRFTDVKEIKVTALRRWLKKAKKIQWDYKNIVKRKGKLIRL